MYIYIYRRILYIYIYIVVSVTFDFMLYAFNRVKGFQTKLVNMVNFLRSKIKREKKSFCMKQLFSLLPWTHSSLFTRSSFASPLSTNRQRKYEYICKEACHYKRRYTYICMCERQHIHKHTNIQTHINLGTYTHKQPSSNTTNTTLTIVTGFVWKPFTLSDERVKNEA